MTILNLSAASESWEQPPNEAGPMGRLLEVADSIMERAEHPNVETTIATSGVTIAQVQEHLQEMKQVFDTVSTFNTAEELYGYLLLQETSYAAFVDEYTMNRCIPIRAHSIPSSYAKTVHQLHPVEYQRDISTIKPRGVVTRFHSCPHCRWGSFTLAQQFQIHMLDKAVTCSSCSKRTCYDTYRIAVFIRNNSSFTVNDQLQTDKVTLTVNIPSYIPADGTWPTYLQNLKREITSVATKGSRDGVTALRKQIYDRVSASMKAPVGGSFSEDLVRAMYRQLDFVNKICANYTYWTHPKIIQAAIHRYEKFVHLMAASKRTMLVPTSDIDLVWHTHQTHLVEYDAFTRRVTGKLLDHDDTIGRVDLSHGYAATFLLWGQMYHEPYSSYAPVYSSWMADYQRKTINPVRLVIKMHRNALWRKFNAIPAADCRFYGVNEAYPVQATGNTVVIPEEEVFAVDGEKKAYVTVIGTPVTDGRVRPQDSRFNGLMQETRLPYVWVAFGGGCSTASVGGGCAVGGCAAGGCSAGGCASGGCASGCGGGGGCGGGCAGG